MREQGKTLFCLLFLKMVNTEATTIRIEIGLARQIYMARSAFEAEQALFLVAKW